MALNGEADGVRVFASYAHRPTVLAAALLSARERVTICGWCLTPLTPLLRGDRQGDSVLANVLREASPRAEVYVLLWRGAPALFEPTERMVYVAGERML